MSFGGSSFGSIPFGTTEIAEEEITGVQTGPLGTAPLGTLPLGTLSEGEEQPTGIERIQFDYGGLGTSETTSSATFTTTPASGNLLVSGLSVNKASGAITIPTGWTRIGTDKISGSVSGSLAYKISDGTEGEVIWSWTNSQGSVVFIAEYSGVDTLDVFAEADSGETSVESQTSGTTAASAENDSLAFAIHGVDTYTNIGPGETVDNSFGIIGTPIANQDVGLIPSEKILTSTGTQETTITQRAGGGSDQIFGKIAVFNMSGAPPAGIPTLAMAGYRRRR